MSTTSRRIPPGERELPGQPAGTVSTAGTRLGSGSRQLCPSTASVPSHPVEGRGCLESPLKRLTKLSMVTRMGLGKADQNDAPWF